MNILYIAYSCSPYHGSEDAIGWNIPLESAKTNRVTVITKEEQRPFIEKYLAEHPVENLHFYYVDIPLVYKRLFRGSFYSGRLAPWNRRACRLAEEICRKEKIDLIHQITPVEFRSIGNYGKISDAAFVCGPVAGGQAIARAFRCYLPVSGAVTEIIRSGMNRLSRLGYAVNGKLRRCGCLLFANRETEAYLSRLIPKEQKHLVMPEIGICGEKLSAGSAERPSGPCRFLVVGRLSYLKGHAFLLDALTRLPDNLNYQVRIVGDGKERPRLEKLCREKGLEHRVEFAGGVPYENMRMEYANADVLVFPTFREATGTVILEAMAGGLPVVTVNRFGGAEILSPECGWLYEGASREECLSQLADSLSECVRCPDEVRRRGLNARRRAEDFTWDKKLARYQRVYHHLANDKKT